MKLFDGIKDFFFAAEEDDFDQLDAPARTEREERPAKSVEREEAPSAPAEREERPVGGAPVAGQRRNGKVVNVQTTAQLQVVLVKPSAFTDA